MEDKLEDIVKQYDIVVKAKYRARGGSLLETDKGLFFARPLVGSVKHLVVEQAVTEHLKEKGISYTDRILCNREGELCSKDGYKKNWVLRVGYRGEECNLKELSGVKQAAGNLARLHRNMTGILPKAAVCESGLAAEYEKHNREMRRVRTYIRGKNRKNDFEVAILNNFDVFFACADESLELLRASDYEKILTSAGEQGIFLHGNYNYHNIINTEKGTATTCFNQAKAGLQVQDLYDLLRKAMEKNQWQQKVGEGLIEEYQKLRPLDREERKLLYIQLLYPEKFWKILNFYYNSRKSWISSRNMQKLTDTLSQMQAKKKFLEELMEH